MCCVLDATCNAFVNQHMWSRVFGITKKTEQGGQRALTLASRGNHWAVCEWLMDEHSLEPVSVSRGFTCAQARNPAPSDAACVRALQTAEDLTHVAVATAVRRGGARTETPARGRLNVNLPCAQAARTARWRRRRSSHWLQAVVACGTGAADALRATVEPSPVLQLLHDGRLTACDDGEGRPLRYMSWYGGMVAAML